MELNNIHFINPAKWLHKNDYNSLSTIQSLEFFINFGLYSIIHELKVNGISSSFHDFCRGYQKEELEISLGESHTNLIGISIISAFNSLCANDILNDAKSLNKDNITIIGGQHYIGHLKTNAFKLFPGADIVVSGEGELAVLEIVKQWNVNGSNLSKWDIEKLPDNVYMRTDNSFTQGRSGNKVIDINNLGNYSYEFYPNVSKFFPSVEFSRGCPHSCIFCANTKSNMINFRSRNSESLLKSIVDILKIYKQKPLRFYLQASNFYLKKDEFKLFIDLFSEISESIEWRTEVRVDTFNEKQFLELYKIGLRIIDIGLDSASLEILNIMKKTINPEQYLKKATAMLMAAKSANIFTKINFLIHPGDTATTLAESKKWLSENKQFISAISACPALLFPGTKLEKNFEYYKKRFGSNLITNSKLSKWGVFEIDPSSSLTLNDAKAYSLEISQTINSREKYAYAKSFGYHGPEASVENIMPSLPFTKDNPLTPYHDN